MNTAVIEMGLDLRILDGYAEPEPAVLRYDPANPLAVTLEFPDQLDECGDAVAWVFWRDLLSRGLLGLVGGPPSDVTLWPNGDHVNLGLMSPDGSVVLALPRDELIGFLVAAYAAVPEGREQVDCGDTVKAFLDRCLDGA
jgi:hypothetical protein